MNRTIDELANRTRAQDPLPESLVYKPGLDRVRESVISSHFMEKLAKNAELELYDDEQFTAKSIEIDAEVIFTTLIPSMLRTCSAFSSDRAAAAKARARENCRNYGLDDSRKIGLSHYITEAMYDPHYLRRPRKNCTREFLCKVVAERIDAGLPIQMVIPALPFKLPSPLKTRGQLPDLAEVGFILGLYEIVATIELIYREGRPDLSGPLAGFTVVSDGSRFNAVVDEPDTVVERYRAHLQIWIRRLGLETHIKLLDYRSLLRDRLPSDLQKTKSLIRDRARAEYAEALWPIFDPIDMAATVEAAARLEPDPEYSRRDGRFISLLSSLVYTINYKSLKNFEQLPARAYYKLYRELTAHIFEPYTIRSATDGRDIRKEINTGGNNELTDTSKEYLRQSMLKEAWTAAIEYIAEIKSDRDLPHDTILTCLPDHFRWTIHAKSGQLGIMTPTVCGMPVQAWAGAAVFKMTKKNELKLCTLPILALEGAGATPVTVRGGEDGLALSMQPLFYISPDVTFKDLHEFLCILDRTLVRNRTS